MYAIVDCNSFYASCEQVFRPDLKGKPVVVLSNNDGCVIARNKEAKKLGVPMGAVAHEWEPFCKENNITIFSSNYALYGDMSQRVMNILKSLAPECEVYSIDEAFLKFHDNVDFNEHGRVIKETVEQWTGIPVSVGFAPTKALSKVANKIAKKFDERTNGVYTIQNHQERIKALKWLKIGDVWGIGRQHAKRLNNIGVFNAYQFTQQPDDWVKKHMSIVGYRLKKELEGKPCLGLDEVKAKKNIAVTRSFARNLDTWHEVKERVTTYAMSCAEKLRRQNSNCAALMVFVKTNRFRKDQEQYGNSIMVNLPYPTNSSIDIVKYAVYALGLIFKDGISYKKAGVILQGITDAAGVQLSLYANKNPKHQTIMQVLDGVNRLNGYDVLKLASQNHGRPFVMRQNRLSKSYTTSWEKLLRVS